MTGWEISGRALGGTKALPSGSLRLSSEGTCAKGVSSTLGRNDPEKKLLKFLAGGFSGSCFFPIFLETGRDFGAAAPLKRPLVNLEIAEVPLRFTQTPSEMWRWHLNAAADELAGQRANAAIHPSAKAQLKQIDTLVSTLSSLLSHRAEILITTQNKKTVFCKRIPKAPAMNKRQQIQQLTQLGTAEATSKQVHSAHSFGYRKWCPNVEARSQRMQCASPVPSLFDVAKLPFFWRSLPE